MRLDILFDFLVDKCGWLGKDASKKDWNTLFSGRNESFMHVWLGTQAQLKYLFKYMLEESKCIKNESGFGPYEILGSHFKRGDNSIFANWNDTNKEPKKDKDCLLQLAYYLDVEKNVSIEDINPAMAKLKRTKKSEGNINGYALKKGSKNYSDEDAGMDFDSMSKE